MYKIIVAAIPRSGSTMVTRALAHLEIKPSWNQDLSKNVYKTHVLEPDCTVDCDKAIFCLVM